VGTSAEETVSTDSLGRRTAPRRQHTIEEKRGIVKETHAYGASVAAVARQHGLNANQVFAWRRLYRQGLLKEGSCEAVPAMLPVKVSSPTVLPIKVASDRAAPKRSAHSGGVIEIDLPSGYCVRVCGRVDAKMLSQVIELLGRR